MSTLVVDELHLQFQPKQDALNDLVETPGIVNIGFGGPRGGGKSRGIRDVMLRRRFEYPGSTGWIVRRTFGEVWDNHIKKYFQERPYMRAWYNTQTKSFTLPNGSSIVAVHAEHEGDLQAQYGKEAMDIFIDQAEQFSEDEHNFIRTCRRAPGIPDGMCKKVDTINPGGVAQKYMKRVYIDQLFKENEIPESFAFIEASGWDNVEWVAQSLAQDGHTAKDFYGWDEDTRFRYFVSRSQYGRDLNALPEKDRIAQLLGKWDKFEGQVFSELGKIHDIDAYFDTSNPTTWSDFHAGMRIIGSLDHASTGVTASMVIGIDVDENMFVLDEYYKRNCLISEHAESIKAMRSGYGQPQYSVIDPSTEAKTLQNKHEMFSVQDSYRREGLTFVSAHRSSIAVGIDLLKELLRVNPRHRNPFTQELGAPRLYVSRRRCPELWDEMIGLQLDDGEYIGSDHAIDCIRYVAMSRPRAAKQKEMDLRRLSTQEQKVYRTHDTWAKAFDKKNKPSETYF